jgi:hypothetical protein
MRKRLIATFAVAASLIVSAQAHHSNAAFDLGKEITLKGSVTEWFWANPHCILQLDVKDEKGQVVEHWVTEGSNPPGMTNDGWSKTFLKSGDQVTVTVQPARNGKPFGRLVQIVLANGKTLSAFGGAKGTVARAAAAGAATARVPKAEEVVPPR